MDRPLAARVVFGDVRFEAEARESGQLPPPAAPEIAFAGRSNVGKSSLLGALVGQPSIVRVSRTPGRTRGILFFGATCGGVPLTLVDLPGYGYARVAKSDKARWGRLIEAYLERRATLRAVVCLIDARHGAQPADRELVEFIAACGRRRILAATKIDKLSKAARGPAIEALSRAFGERILGVSAVDGAGLEPLKQAILGATA